MSWKKNGFGYFVWACVSLLVCVTFAVGILYACSVNSVMSQIQIVGITCAAFLIIVGIFLCIFFGAEKIRKAKWQVNGKALRCVEAGSLLIFFLLGIAIRIMTFLQMAGTSVTTSTLFMKAQVVAGQTAVQSPHPLVTAYLNILHILFLLLGNKWQIVVVLQIVLQVLAACMIFAAIRKIAGRISGVLTFAAVMCLPRFYTMCEVPSAFHLFFFLFSIGFMVTCFGMSYFMETEKKKNGFFVCVILGILQGLLIMTHISFAVLTVFLFALASCKSDKISWKTRLIGIACVLGGLLLGIGTFLLGSVLIGANSLGTILTGWLNLYKLQTIQFLMQYQLSFMVVIAFSIFSIIAFLFLPKNDFFMGWFVLFVSIMAISVFKFQIDYIDEGLPLVTLGYSILAAVGIGKTFALEGAGVIDEVVIMENAVKIEKAVKKEKAMKKEKAVKAEKTVKIEETVKVEKKEPGAWLDNPLPVPKRHVKKEMDYTIEPTAELMHYDIEVSDDDDFDILE